MKTLRKAWTRCFTLLSLALVFSASSYAQEPLKINGIASYKKLNTDYYIGALYLENLQSSPDAAIFTPAHKRMVILITTTKWRSRQFAKDWQHMISINNDPDRLQEYSKSIIAFTQMAKPALVKGDLIVIEAVPGKGTTVRLNGKLKVTDPSDKLFGVLLSAWIGPVPPSSDFKLMMMNFDPNNAVQESLFHELEKSYEG